MPRYATIDVGTNSVLLLVAERGPDGRFTPVAERAEITRLGQGVDQARRLAPEAMERTAAAVAAFAAEARALGAEAVVATATSAARDAANGADFVALVRSGAGVDLEVISGDDEARLSFASAFADFGGRGPLVVLDIGGGSTEFIFGDAAGAVRFRRSFDVGSVRLTERLLRGDPPGADELTALRTLLAQTFNAVPAPDAGTRLVAVAGTATTVLAVARAVEPYDAGRVHGAQLALTEVEAVAARLAALPLAQRRALPGLQPKRADVIVAGALVLLQAMRALGVAEVTVSDRGLRWGLLADRFGGRT